MKSNQIKKSSSFAKMLIDNNVVLVSEKSRASYEYVNNEKTDKIKAYVTDLILVAQNFEKVRCETRIMPTIFVGAEKDGAVQVELVNASAEVLYNNEIKFYADDIVLSDKTEVTV